MKKEATTIDQARKPPSGLSFLVILCEGRQANTEVDIFLEDGFTKFKRIQLHIKCYSYING